MEEDMEEDMEEEVVEEVSMLEAMEAEEALEGDSAMPLILWVEVVVTWTWVVTTRLLQTKAALTRRF